MGTPCDVPVPRKITSMPTACDRTSVGRAAGWRTFGLRVSPGRAHCSAPGGAGLQPGIGRSEIRNLKFGIWDLGLKVDAQPTKKTRRFRDAFFLKQSSGFCCALGNL